MSIWRLVEHHRGRPMYAVYFMHAVNTRDIRYEHLSLVFNLTIWGMALQTNREEKR